MTHEHKEGGCCGGGEQKSTNSCGSCCKVKKVIIGLLVIGLSFAAGMMFAKSCPLAKPAMCPMSTK